MKILIVEDDFFSRMVLKELMTPFGECDYAMNGKEAIAAFSMALSHHAPYDLICMDIMMPEMDGQEALKIIRQMESERQITGSHEVKVIMTTAISDPKSIIEAYYQGGATSYLVKPISKAKLMAELKSFQLI